MAATAGTVQSSRGHLSMDVSDSQIEVSFVQSDWSLPVYIDVNFIIKKKTQKQKQKQLTNMNLNKNIAFTKIESIEWFNTVLYCYFGDRILIKQY